VRGNLPTRRHYLARTPPGNPSAACVAGFMSLLPPSSGFLFLVIKADKMVKKSYVFMSDSSLLPGSPGCFAPGDDKGV